MSLPILEYVLYINLNHRIDRNQHILLELAKLGIKKPGRFNAIKMQNGAIGCTMSHIKCLEMAKEHGWPYVMICEDDAVFSQPDILLDSARKFLESNIDWDVLLIGANNVPPYDTIPGGFCIKVNNAQTTTCYIVKQHYYDALIQNMREGVAKFIKNPELKKECAIDIYWKRLQPIGKWYLLTPLTVYQKEDYSDIENRTVDYRHLMLDIDKHWLFQKRFPR